MNKNLYRVILNKTLGLLTVVAENISSKSAQGGTSNRSGISIIESDPNHYLTNHLNQPKTVYARLKALAFNSMLAMGAVVTTVSLASISSTASAAADPAVQGKIVADPTAPKTQQATVLNASNGILQVNIQTPSAAGVSRNTYNQFDVGSNGAILNNSRIDTSTKLAGMVQANPWLAKGEARVILNEVNSSNPSYLRGYMEVAGGNAQVVVANPAGISCEGCGFINANRATLTTGTPLFGLGGSLEAYRVTGGQINIAGLGFDTSTSNYTDIISRALNINAGIWAKTLNVSLGINTVAVDYNKDPADPTQSQVINKLDGTQAINSPTPTNDTLPQQGLALDVANLGGMYAGKITLVGTEAGLGVRNAGNIGASAGDVMISADGRLTNSGKIEASSNTQIKSHSTLNPAVGGITNTGSISATRELLIHTDTATNAGGATDINNAGGALTAARLDLQAGSLDNTGGKIIQTDIAALNIKSGGLSNAQGGLIGYAPVESGNGTGGSAPTPNPTNPTDPTEPTTPTEPTPTDPATPTNPLPTNPTTPTTPTTPVEVLADGMLAIDGLLDNTAGQITAGGGVTLASTNGLNNAGGTLNVKTLDVTGDDDTTFDNTAGSISSIHGVNIATGLITNQSGKIFATDINMRSSNPNPAANPPPSTGISFNNTSGQINASNTLTLNSAGLLNNTNGVLAANETTQITTGSLDNTSGQIISSNSTLDINSAGLLSNSAGTLQAAGNVTLKAQAISNDAGKILTGSDLSLSSQTNTRNLNQGKMAANSAVNLTTGTLSNNSNSSISAGTTLNITATGGNINNNQGTLIANDALQVTGVGSLHNSQGQIQSLNSGVSLTLSQDVNNGVDSTTAGSINSKTDLNINALNINNAGDMYAGANTHLTAAGAANSSINNSGSIAALGNTQLEAIGSSSSINSTGSLIAGLNADGSLASTGDLLLTATQAVNATGQNIAAQTLTASSNAVNLSGSQTAGNNINLTANTGNIDLSKATVKANQTFTATANNAAIQTLITDAGHLTADVLALNISNLSNVAGEIVHTSTSDLTLLAASKAGVKGTINNNQGHISSSSKNLTLTAQDIQNNAGLIDHAATAASTLSDGVLTIIANSLEGHAGQINTNGALNVNVAGAADLSSAKTNAAQITLHAGSLDHQAGVMIGSGANTTQISIDSALNNNAGFIGSNANTVITAGSLSNQAGTVQSAGLNGAQSSLNITTHSGQGTTGNIDNSQQGQLLGSGDVILNASGSLDNTSGVINSGKTITATVAGEINNSAGNMVATEDVTATAASFQNYLGKVASKTKALTVTTTGTTNNSNGEMAAATIAAFKNTGLINTSGGKISAASISIDTQQNTLDNSSGSISAADNLTVTSGTLTNDAGLIQTTANNSSLSINTNGQTLTNTNSGATGGISSQGTLGLMTGDANNSAGFIGANGNVTLNSAAINNSSAGQISSSSNVTLTGTTLNNSTGLIVAGSQTGTGDINATLTGDVTNDAGLIRAGNKVTLSTTGLLTNSNTNITDKGIQGLDVDVTANTVNNQSGSIITDQTLNVLAQTEVQNQSGLISGGTVNITDQQAALGQPKALILTNTGGTLIAGQALNINTHSAGLDGKMLSQGDLSLNVDTDLGFTAANTSPDSLNANHDLTITTQGNITNTGVLNAGNTLKVSANNIDNQLTGEFNAHTTDLTAVQTLTNRGLIDSNGGETLIHANLLDNVGTGRIYGDHIAIQANTLNNREELNADGTTTAAVIAARGDLDIGVGTLTNQEHALLFSGADMRIAGSLDGNNQATQGQATAIYNKSANIESTGNMWLTANTLKNSNEHFSTEMVIVAGPTDETLIQPVGTSQPIPLSNFVWEKWSRAGQYRYITTPSIDDSGVLGVSPIPQVGEQNCTDDTETSCAPIAGAGYPVTDPAWTYFSITPPNAAPIAPTLVQPIAPDPAGNNACLAGAGYDAVACGIYQTALDQYNADNTAYNQAWTDYANATQAWQAETDAKYTTLDDAITAYNQTFANQVVRNWTQYEITTTESESKVKTTDPSKILVGGNLTLAGTSLINDKSQIIVGGTLAGDLNNLSNIDAEGQHVVHVEGTTQYTHERWRGGFRRWHQRDWDDAIAYTPADIVTTITLPALLLLENTASLLKSKPDSGSTTGVGQGLVAKGHSSGGASSGQIIEVTSTVLVVDPKTGKLVAAGTGTNTNTTTNAPDANGSTTQTSKPATVRTSSPNITIPNNALFKTNPNNNNAPLIETDPRFASYKNWLSSDYMLQQYNTDPTHVQKRLGDGFYEQKLIREQIAQLTGKRFLDGYASDQDEFKALMDNGLTFAKAFNLTVGVALTPAQMAQLTSDIVWLVEQTVTLPDGTTQRVLVPQVYLCIKQGDLKGDGALISASNLNLNLSGDLNNAGTIAGRNVTAINAANVNNIGGRITGDTVGIHASNDVNVVGGTIDANHAMDVTAGHDVNVTTTTHSGTVTNGASSFEHTGIDRVAGLYVTNPSGTLNVHAGHDVVLTGATIDNKGSGGTSVTADNNVLLAAVKTSDQKDMVANANNYLKYGHSEDNGSTISGGGNVTIDAGNSVTATAATINSKEGDVTVHAVNDVTFNAGEEDSNYGFASKQQHNGVLGNTTSTTKINDTYTGTVGNDVNAGGNVTITSDQGDITAHSTQIKAGGDALLDAKNGAVTMTADVNTTTHSLETSNSDWATYNNHQEGYYDQTASASSIEAGGKVTVNADKAIHLTATDVTAGSTVKFGDAEMVKGADGKLYTKDGSNSPDSVTQDSLTLEHNEWNNTQSGYKGPVKEFVKVATAAASLGNFGLVPQILANNAHISLDKHDNNSHNYTTQAESNLNADRLEVNTSGDATFTSTNIDVNSNRIAAQHLTIDLAEDSDNFKQDVGSSDVSGLKPHLNNDSLSLGGVKTTSQKTGEKTSTTTHKMTTANLGDTTWVLEDGADTKTDLNITNHDIDLGKGNWEQGGYENKNTTDVQNAVEVTKAEAQLRNANIDAIKAADAVTKAGEAVKAARDAYSKAQQDYAAGKITKDALHDYETNLAAATYNVGQATFALVAATGTAAATNSITGGFTLNGNLTHDTTTTNQNNAQGSWQGSTVNITGDGKIYGDGGKSGNSKIVTTGSTFSDTGNTQYGIAGVETQAGTEHSSSSSSSQSNGQAMGVTVGVGVSANVSGSHQSSDADSTGVHYVGSTVNLGNASGEIGLIDNNGGNVTLHKDDDASLTIDEIKNTTLQDTYHSSNSGGGFNAGLSFGSAGVTGGNAGVNHSSGYTNSTTTSNVASVLFTGDANLDEMGVNRIINTAGVVANGTRTVDPKTGAVTFIDEGNLTYSGVIENYDLTDSTTTQQTGYNVQVSGDTHQSTADSSQTVIGGNTTFGIKNTGHETVTNILGTIGNGNVSNAGTANRDVNNTKEVVKDQITGALDTSITVDNRWLTENGREEVLAEQKQLITTIENLPSNIRGAVADAVVSVIKAFPNISPEKQKEVMSLAITIAALPTDNLLTNTDYRRIVESGISLTNLNKALRQPEVGDILYILDESGGKFAQDVKNKPIETSANMDGSSVTMGQNENETTFTLGGKPSNGIQFLDTLKDIGDKLNVLPPEQREALMLSVGLITQGPIGLIKNVIIGKAVDATVGDALNKATNYGAALLNGAARDTDADTIVAILANPDDYIAHSSDPDKAREVVANLQVSQQGAALAMQMIMGAASTVGGKGSKPSAHEEPSPNVVGNAEASAVSAAKNGAETTVNPSTQLIDGVTITDIKTGANYHGTVDLQPTLERIKSGESFPHRNDGSVFKNLPDRNTGEIGLPDKPIGYYTEYVVPTPNMQGVGPQRIVVGQNGEKYYTPDHYKTFIRIQ